jgi:hypothetical protein
MADLITRRGEGPRNEGLRRVEGQKLRRELQKGGHGGLFVGRIGAPELTVEIVLVGAPRGARPGHAALRSLRNVTPAIGAAEGPPLDTHAR